LSLEERGAYIELLTHMWGFAGGCWLPDEDGALARLLGVTPEKWQALRAVLIDGPLAVFQSDGQRLTNARLLVEWDKATAKSRKAAAAVQARHDRNTSAVRTQYERSTDVERTNNERSTDDVPPRDPRSQIPDKEEEEEAPAGAPARNPWEEPDPPEWTELVTFIRLNRFGWSQTEDTMAQVREWAIDTECAVVRRAVQEALDNNASGWSYARKCLRDWYDAGARTLADVESLIAERRRKRSQGSRDSPGQQRRPSNVLVRGDPIDYEGFVKRFPTPKPDGG